mmetsp:Transcript_33062/g.80345  ORF Transcript_33062/g.80345 Transcript_33062/m.80345 type:complete len:141 (-) Transcript_33062:228-650(-)
MRPSVASDLRVGQRNSNRGNRARAEAKKDGRRPSPSEDEEWSSEEQEEVTVVVAAGEKQVGSSSSSSSSSSASSSLVNPSKRTPTRYAQSIGWGMVAVDRILRKVSKDQPTRRNTVPSAPELFGALVALLQEDERYEGRA